MKPRTTKNSVSLNLTINFLLHYFKNFAAKYNQ